MQSPFDQISLVGFGNVGSHLYKLFQNHGIHVSHILTKTGRTEDINNKTLLIRNPEELPNHQLTIICVNDDAISSVVDKIDPSIPVAYTSGSVNISSIKSRDDLGVFYPLQTFSKGHELKTPEFPILIEANNPTFEKQLRGVALTISSQVQLADSAYRAKIHLVAVWVNNFTNHIIHLAKKRSNVEQVDFELLKPLLMETVAKLHDMNPYEAQTGPARRGDRNTIQGQANNLTGIEKEIYELINRSIIESYNTHEEL